VRIRGRFRALARVLHRSCPQSDQYARSLRQKAGPGVAIDGRDIARARAAAEAGAPQAPPSSDRDAYQSPAIRILSQALIWVPAAFLVWLAYVSGAWMGDWTTGVASVLSTVLSFALFLGWRRLRHRRR
jgi:Flp pilus assembly protein TadB